LVLIGVGLIVCAKISRLKGALLTAAFWLLSLIPPVALAVLGTLMASAFTGG
jgi:hypothetical protein